MDGNGNEQDNEEEEEEEEEEEQQEEGGTTATAARFKKAKDLYTNAPIWKKRLAKELLKRKKKIFPRRRIYSPGVDSIWAADLADVHRYAKQNKNNTFILVLIDLFSKKAWARGLKFKTGEETAAAIKDVFRKSG